MNFFEHQDRARRNTGRLIVLFAAAVIGIIVLVYVLVVVLLPFAGLATHAQDGTGIRSAGLHTTHWWDPMTLALVTGGVVAVVGLASAYKVAQLRGGGAVVAEELGGRLLTPDTRDLKERRLLNVVEEMAIASGVSVPPVYLLADEKGINAFAAGYSSRDAVIGVTRGTVETLSRDELQGVLAHEFSHILNGDMRLNIRLIGILFGILVIGLIGQILLRTFIYAPRTSRRGRGGGDGGSVVILIIGVGIGLMVIGFVGTFFGNLIKASVSRQREFLADASAVQFTRNPGGIGGALKKIGGLHFGSKVRSGAAAEASHMFFAAGLASALGSLTATHPPLPERIRRIDPQWDGSFPEVPTEWAREGLGRVVAEQAEREHAMAGLAGLAGLAALGGAPAQAPGASQSTAIEGVGTLSQRNIRYAAELLERVPESVATAAREPFSARGVVLAMLLDTDETIRATQMRIISTNDDGMVRVVESLRKDVAALDPKLRMPVLDIAIGALRTITKPQYETFRDRVTKLIAADSKRDLFEWVLLRILKRHLDAHFFKGEARTPVQYYSLGRLGGECRNLLSTLAYAGQSDRGAAARAFEAGASRLRVRLGTIADPGACGLRALDDALAKLEQVSPKLKKEILGACAACIAADRQVTLREGELLRAISDNLDCPMPPLLPGQPLV